MTSAFPSIDDTDLLRWWREAHGKPPGGTNPPAQAVRSALDSGYNAWPNLQIAPADFVRRLATSCEEPEDLDRLAVDDLYLAVAATQGAKGAAEAFEKRCGPQIDAALRRFASQGDALRDIRADLHERLLVGSERRPPRIVEYQGRGSLPRWTRAVATRIALDRLRGRGRLEHPTTNAAMLERLDEQGDLEFRYLREHYRDAAKAAFHRAVDDLDASEKRLLREHLIFGLSTSRLARLHGVHKSTAARRLASARQALIDGVHRHIADRLSVDDAELRSVLKLVSSQLDVSLARILETRPDDPKR